MINREHLIDYYYLPDEAIACAAIYEIRRLSADGVAPSSHEYTRRHDPDSPGVAIITRRLGWTWTQLARRAGLEYYANWQLRCDPMERGLPDFLRNSIQNKHLCECGAPAMYVGNFMSFSGDGNKVRNAMVLCGACAQLVDEGVRVERIEQGVRA